MLRSVFLKTLYDKRWFIWGWALGVVVLLAGTAAFFPSFRDSGIDELMNAIPSAMKNMLGSMAGLNTFPGYVGSGVFGLRAQLFFIPLAIILGISLGVSEEARGRLYQLLAQPVSRSSVAWQKFVAGIVIIIVVVGVGVASVGIVASLILEPVPYMLLFRIGVSAILFSAALFSLTYSLGLAFGKKSLALTVPIAWVLFSVLCDAFSGQVEWLKHIDYASVLHYFRTAELVDQQLNLRHVAVLLGMMIVPFLLSLPIFNKRDLHEEVS